MTRIGIIGGGIGGLSAAIALTQQGFTCDVFEQAPEFREVGAAISIWPNALRVYQHLGILDGILEHSNAISDAYIRSSSGQVLVHSHMRYALPAICLHRADLIRGLVRHIPEERLHSAHKLTDYRCNDNGSVTALFENVAQFDCDMLLAADGINSLVRQKIIGDGAPIYRGYNVWRGVATMSFDQGYGSETLGRGNRVGIVQIRPGQYGWWATANEAEGASDDPEGTLARLRRTFSTWHDPIPSLFEHSPKIIKNSISDRVPTTGWSQGNVVLLGDAAHPTTPNLGQGACMAVEGAFLLARALRKYDLTQQAYKAYESAHYSRTREINRQSLLLGKIGQLENPLGTRMRNLAFKLQPNALAMRLLDRYFDYDVAEVPL